MCRADPTQKQAAGAGVLYNHMTINNIQGVAAPTPSAIRKRLRSYVLKRFERLSTFVFQNPTG